MAMNKVYTRINWEDYPSENTDLDAYNLNQMDSAIDALDNRIILQDAIKVDKTTINDKIAGWTMDETTGIITITKYNGEKVIFDLNIEKIPVGFSMSDDGIITMTTEDGTQFTADIGSMIPVLTFEDSATIAVSVTGTGKNKTYSFSIKTGSVTDDMLQPNYLADIRVESANASAYAQSANAKSVLAESYAVGGTGTREGEDTDNAKYYMEQAKQQTGGIPTKVSELENDAGYITKKVSDLTNYYDKTTVDEKIDAIPKTDLTNYLTKTGDGSNLTAAFEEATTLEELTTGEKLSSIFGKLKLAVKNLKSLISLIGTTDISTIGDGTITGGLNDVNGKLIASDNVPFRFGVNSNGEYGYIITNPAGADTVIPFSSEASYAAALYNALKPSGLVNANMTFNQLIAVVASQNPATYSLIRSGWTVGTAGGAITPSASSNGSAVTLKIASQTGMSSYVYYTSPAINLSSFKTLTLQGSSYKVTGNPYGSDDYRPKVKLLNASGVEVTTLYAHPNYDKEKTTYTINTSYNCSSLSGNYYLRLQMFSYSSTDSTNVGSYITLTKALFST